MDTGVFRDLLRDMSRAKVVTTPKAEWTEKNRKQEKRGFRLQDEVI